MTNKRALLILSGTGILVIMALTLMWGALVGAAPSGAWTGVVGAEPGAVSDSEDVGDDARTVMISVTDPDLDSAAYVGQGPNKEPNVLGDGDDGISVTVDASQLGGTGVVELMVPVDLDGDGSSPDSSPIGDYDGDGDVDIHDIVIVDSDLNGDGTDGDIAVASIFNAGRGQVMFNIFQTGLSAAQPVQLRYASAVRQLTRAPKSGITATHELGADLAEDGTVTIELDPDTLPIQDSNGDGSIDGKDVTATAVGASGVTLTVTSIGDAGSIGSYEDGSAAGNTIVVTHTEGDTLEAASKIRVTYTGLEDLVAVRGARDVAHKIRLRETGASTGVFVGSIKAINGEDPAVEDFSDYSLMPQMGATDQITRIAVIQGDNVTVTYNDRSNAAGAAQAITKIIDVDPDPPTFTNITPSDDSSTNDLTAELSVEVSDTIGGVNPKSVVFSVGIGGGALEERDSEEVTVAETSAGSGVYMVSFPVNKIAEVKSAIDDDTNLDLNVEWSVSVKDVAGNQGDTGSQTLRILKQTPRLVGAATGNNWDAGSGAVSTAKTANGDDRTSVEVMFSVPLTGASVDADDFTVDGAVPSDAEHFSGASSSVFLTVDALAPDATPTVAIVGEVEDTGGNIIDSGSTTAADGIAPDLTVTFTGGNYSKSGVEVSVVSDEPIAGSLPSRAVYKCTTSADSCDGAASHTQRSSVVETRKEWAFSMSGFGVGRYSLIVGAQDTNGNKVQAGDMNSKKGLSFEIDKSLPAPTKEVDGSDVLDTVPAPGGSITLGDDTLLRIRWETEADEYVGDSHTTVWITKMELDGVDVSDQVSTRDNKNFTVTVGGSLELGSHSLVFNATDEAGNALSQDAKLDFTVVLRDLYQLNLNPGINLVSLPSDPASTNINDVITSNDNINLVFTYNPADPRGPWLFASRESADDPFTGDLETIDGNHAYFMRAVSDVTLKVDVPPTDPARPAPPKTFNVVQGWNLVPVSDITRQAFDSTIDADSYLTGIDWTRALTYDSNEAQPWVVVSPGTGAGLKVGFGYWLWANSAGQIIPGG